MQATVPKFTDAYRALNLQDALDCFARDGDLVLYGTGADEKRIGVEQVRAPVERDRAQSDGVALSFGRSSVSSAGPVAGQSFWLCRALAGLAALKDRGVRRVLSVRGEAGLRGVRR